MNTDKTSLFFSRNTAENLRVAFQSKLGVPMIREHEKYLGLPSFVFFCLKESVRSFKVLFANFGGVKKVRKDELTGWLGRGCVPQSFIGGWDFVI
jgi:hypothetical protein